MSELILSRPNSYNEFCSATSEQLRSALDNISRNMGVQDSEKITIKCRETQKEAQVTVSYRSPNEAGYPMRKATAILGKVIKS